MRPISQPLYTERLEKVIRTWPEGALHIAVAAVNRIDVVITWNFAHMSNPFTRRKVRKIIEGEGFICPEICSPEELLEVEK